MKPLNLKTISLLIAGAAFISATNSASAVKGVQTTYTCPLSSEIKWSGEVTAAGGFKGFMGMISPKLTFENGKMNMGEIFVCNYKDQEGKSVQLSLTVRGMFENCSLSGPNNNTLTCTAK